jgi:hypothetical protein
MARRSTHSELGRLLEAARRDIPSISEQKHLHASILTALRSGTAPQSALTDLPLDGPSPTIGLTLKLILSLGAAAVLAAGVTQLRHHTYTTAHPDSASLAPTSSAATSSSSSTRETPPISAPSQSTAPEQAETPSAASPQNDIAPTARRTAAGKPQSPETAIIEQARRQLQSDPAQALALTETHRKLYPRGILAQEREVIAIEALARLGKSTAAEKRANAFRAKQPHSIHDLHLRSTLGDAGVRPQP